MKKVEKILLGGGGVPIVTHSDPNMPFCVVQIIRDHAEDVLGELLVYLMCRKQSEAVTAAE